VWRKFGYRAFGKLAELHALAHQEGLPIQHFEDESLVFTAQEEVKK
jgi:hypothetical protein